MVLVLLMYVSFVIPFRTAFETTLTAGEKARCPVGEKLRRVHVSTPHSLGSLLQAFDVFIDLMFMTDVVLNFVTGFVLDTGELEMRPRRVAINYLKGWFLIDVFTSFPFDIIAVRSAIRPDPSRLQSHSKQHGVCRTSRLRAPRPVMETATP